MKPIYWSYISHCFQEGYSVIKDPLTNLEFFDFIYYVKRLINGHNSVSLRKLNAGIDGLIMSVKQAKRNIGYIKKEDNIISLNEIMDIICNKSSEHDFADDPTINMINYFCLQLNAKSFDANFDNILICLVIILNQNDAISNSALTLLDLNEFFMLHMKMEIENEVSERKTQARESVEPANHHHNALSRDFPRLYPFPGQRSFNLELFTPWNL